MTDYSNKSQFLLETNRLKLFVSNHQQKLKKNKHMNKILKKIRVRIWEIQFHTCSYFIPNKCTNDYEYNSDQDDNVIIIQTVTKEETSDCTIFAFVEFECIVIFYIIWVTTLESQHKYSNVQRMKTSNLCLHFS